MKTGLITRRNILASFLCSGLLYLTPNKVISGDFEYDSSDVQSWPHNIVMEVQNRLQDMGHDPGTIDGIYGPKTRQGIKSFQRSIGIRVDGRITDQLLNRLEIY